MISKIITRLWLCLIVVALAINLAPADAEENGDSLFNVPFKWTSEQGKPFELADLKGNPTLISMIYTQCKSACPLTIQRVRAIEEKLGDHAKHVNFLLVTLDPGRDKASELLSFKKSHDIDRQNWHLLTGSDADVRKFSVLVGVSFQKDSGTQEILHSNRLIVLSPDGQVDFTLEGLASDTQPLVDAIVKNIG